MGVDFNILPDYVNSLNLKHGVYYVTQSGTSGYANAAKGYIYDLIQRNIPVKIHTVDLDFTKITETSSFDRFITSHTKNVLSYDTVIVHATPNIWDVLLQNAKVNSTKRKIIGRTVWEFEKVPIDWVTCINKSRVDIVSVPTEWNKTVFEKNGIIKPIIVEPHIFIDYPHNHVELTSIIDHSGEIFSKHDITSEQLQDHYKFYTIGQFIPRKGIVETIESFCKTFTSHDKTVLIVKTFGKDYSSDEVDKCKSAILSILSNYDHAPVVFVKNQLTYDEVRSLHHQCDCYIQLTRSEGFGLGIFESYKIGKNVIVTGYGGQTEFLPINHYGLVDHSIVNVQDTLFFNVQLDESYTWAKPNIDHASHIMSDIFIKNRQSLEKVDIEFMENTPLILSSGWYDLERHQNTNFRWMHLKSKIDVVNTDYTFVTLVFANHVNKKTLKFYTTIGDDTKVLVSEKSCEIGERCYIRLSLHDVKEIFIESDAYYCPHEKGDSEDRRKLSVMMFQFEFEKNKDNKLYIQSIENIPHKKDNLHFKIIQSNSVLTKTNSHFVYEKVEVPTISTSLTHGVLLYLPNITGKHCKTLDNLAQYKHSKYDSQIVVYTDGDISGAEKYPFEFIQIDPLPAMYDGMMPVHYKYATWAFFEGIKIAKSKSWDYFFCYEWDCMIGKDYWYDTLWQEHLSWPYEPIMTGTPVFKCPLTEVGNLLQGSMDYRYQYSKDCGLYMNIEHVNPTSLYTNGALTFYNTNKTSKYFSPELEFNGDVSSYMDSITSWDLEIGIRLFKEYGEKSFEKVGWLPSSYSGCGDYYYNQKQRESMLTSGQKVVIHQYKYEN